MRGEILPPIHKVPFQIGPLNAGAITMIDERYCFTSYWMNPLPRKIPGSEIFDACRF